MRAQTTSANDGIGRPAGQTGAVRRVDVVDWGRVGYAAAMERQLALVSARAEGRIPDTIACVRHPATITLGRNAPDGDVVASPAALAQRGIELVRSDRGGRATYHGPGQAIVYPIVSLAERGLGVKSWVELLEDSLLEALASYRLAATRRPASPGLWIGDAKIASVGLRVVRGVSYHGVSLNVGLDVSGFDCIVTCGVAGQRVTAVAAEIAPARDGGPAVREAASRIAHAIRSRLS